ncbi:MAG: bifunctional (p)ppGpp synthetase/guanosine-3',5'-bis(diphosphate) 3'-pyrophosphohydrolase [Bacillota bacterium]|jgi:GTP pyrophosphokinase|nr:bifunctional (p)ppGpp synthetase/guanosine-3',5'-bis(diphosphate) 3'-pyrophosphohydrolase [Bacillota bacterium]HHU29733.1 bifunctional (p)ppGpp synthetase/guanosine-3',5'-bis(diphosphate) 3'-pyrophosphohydrolase [Bacillota bacterium]
MKANLQTLKEKIRKYYPVTPDWKLLEKAYRFAVNSHQGQKRFSGELYITHPLGVAIILAELELDMDTIIAGLLHDVVEDTDVTLEEIEQQFGDDIAMLVDGVTKLSKLEYKSKAERQAENLRKMFIAMAKDIRVLLIKLADRTHNMRTLKYLSSLKQQSISRETLEIYAPLAHRLGIYKIKWELEDLAFRFLERDRYYALADKLAKKRDEREAFIKQVIETLQPKLEEVNIKANVSGRPKHLYSISQKMKEQYKEFHEIYDLTAIRIIVDSIKDCYGALGIVHTLWKPIPGRFKDYIAMPKPNMYQSLHTLVMVGKNELLEVQIRTWDMHRTAEYGIAAHWRYKEKKDSKQDDEFEKKLSWLRQIMELQQDSKDASEFMENIKLDLFSDEVFVFTPKGDVIDLPAGSIPLDFAYKIHTDIGHRCVGARVNGRLVPLDYELKTGDIVEIITSKQGSPSRDWLNMVKSSGARARIRSWFKKERREENVGKGREMVEKELRRQDLDLALFLKSSLLLEAGKRFNIHSEEDLYVSVGVGAITPQQVVSKLKEEYRKKEGLPEREAIKEFTPPKKVGKTGKGVRIDGIDNLLLRFAKCCTPVPGDNIVGVVTRGRGVSIHRRDCHNVKNSSDALKLLDAEWEENAEGLYPVEIEVTGMDSSHFLSDVVNAVAESKVNISALNARRTKDRLMSIRMTVTVKDINHLDNVISKINRVRDVYSVHRNRN